MLKRILSLICMAALLIGCISVTASAAFTDQSAIHHENAVEMLSDLGVISGYDDGSFRPKSYISRQAMAKILAKVLTDNPTGSTASAFSDVPASSQFAPYISYLYEKGLVSGSNGKFLPTAPITARALAKILIGALGYDTASYVGTGWAERVDAKAAELGIYDGFYEAKNSAITRDSACLLILNAMQSYLVDGYDADGNVVYHLDDLMNPQTLLEYRYHVTQYTEMLTANAYADMEKIDSHLESGYSRLARHNALAVETTMDMLGRNIVLYADSEGNVVGVPTFSPYELYDTLDDFDEFVTFMERLPYTIPPSTKYYYNYNESTLQVLLALSDSVEDVEITIVDHTGDGIIDVVLMIEYQLLTVTKAGDTLMAKTADGSVVTVTAEADKIALLQAGDTVSAAYIGGRYVLKSA